MMGLEEEKTINMTFSTFAAHYSIIPTFHYSMREAESSSYKKSLNFPARGRIEIPKRSISNE